ncbi:SlyX family protein [Camelimonas abortus]|uniref:Protein SlyX homolog n=1 Tax=Camelimonas abortus TaxID=1017184 RepID=A0ABV7LE16_9HYPH
MTDAQRITELEIRVAEQEKTIEELSQVVAGHWHDIDQLTRKVDALTRRLLALEEQLAPEAPVTRPPHW